MALIETMFPLSFHILCLASLAEMAAPTENHRGVCNNVVVPVGIPLSGQTKINVGCFSVIVFSLPFHLECMGSWNVLIFFSSGICCDGKHPTRKDGT